MTTFQMAPRSVQLSLWDSRLSNRQTYRPRHICNYRPHLCTVCMRCGLIHTHPFNGPLFGTTQISQYQKGKTHLDFTEASYSEWQWHLLGQMQVCTSLQTDNHSSTPPLSFLQAGCLSCRPTNSVNALKAHDAA